MFRCRIVGFASLVLIACSAPESETELATAQSALSASWDPTLRVPRCGSITSQCDTGPLVNGRASLGEPNAPNTLKGTCPDGTVGPYHVRESLDRLAVTTVDGSSMVAGKTVRIDATVWASPLYSADALDLYYAADALNPVWTLIKTLTPPGSGARVLSTTYTLPAGGTQAVRGQFRYGGSPSSPCVFGSYNDRDDLVFQVGADQTPPTVTIVSPAPDQVVGDSVRVVANVTDNVVVSKVEFRLGSTLTATVTTPPYEAEITGIAGIRPIRVRGVDGSGNVSEAMVVVHGDVAPPTVTLASPAVGATVRRTLPLQATATDDTGIDRVEFYVDDTLLGTVTTPPYSIDWDSKTVPNGEASLRVTAYDLAARVRHHLSTVIVDNDVTPPEVTITSPAPGAAVSGPVILGASATDGSSEIVSLEFEVDGQHQGTVASASGSVSWSSWTVANGAHSLVVRATDAEGNVGTASLPVVTDNDFSPPTVAIAAPSAGATVEGIVTVTADAADDRGVSEVQFFINGALRGTDNVPPFTYAWDTRAGSNGSFELRAKAFDAAGNSAVGLHSVTVSNDRWAPAVSIQSPAANANVAGWTSVSATAIDSREVTVVQLLVDEVVVGELTAAPYTFAWNAGTVSPGTHTVTVRASDAASNWGTASVLVNVLAADTSPPRFVGFYLSAGQVLAGRKDVLAYAEDDVGVTRIELLVDGVVIGEALEGPFWFIEWNPTVADNGPHEVTARAYDGAGNVGYSAPVQVTVDLDLEAPVFDLASPAEGEVLRGSYTWAVSATDRSRVSHAILEIDSERRGFYSCGSPPMAVCNVRFDSGHVAEGPHIFTLKVADEFGNTAAKSVNVVVARDLTPPTVAITAPAADELVTDLVELVASAADEHALSEVRFYVNDEPVGVDTEPPFSALWYSSTAANGPAVIYAEAVDSSGNVTRSTPVNVLVDNYTPTLSVTSPVPGELVAGRVKLTAETNIPGATVGFFVNGIGIGSDDSAPYEVYWNSSTTGTPGSAQIYASSNLDEYYNSWMTSESVGVEVGPDPAVQADAVFDPLLLAPSCSGVISVCDGVDHHFGRGPQSPEVNAPNTLHGLCVDGDQGSHEDVSVFRLLIQSDENTVLHEGAFAHVLIGARTNSWSEVDFYFAPNASDPQWELLGTQGLWGIDYLSFPVVLGPPGRQAVRAVIRTGTTQDVCPTGAFDEADDLVFDVVP